MKRFYRPSFLYYSLLFVVIAGLQHNLKAGEKLEMSPAVYNKLAATTAKISDDQNNDLGSGVIIAVGGDGYVLVLTACSVIASNRDKHLKNNEVPLEFRKNLTVKVPLAAFDSPATVIEEFVDARNNVAIVAAVTTIAAKYVIQTDRDFLPSPGQPIAVAGYPEADDLRFAFGKVEEAPANGPIRFKTKLSKGHTGGPLVDRNGNLIGLVVSHKGEALPIAALYAIAAPWTGKARAIETVWTEGGPSAQSETEAMPTDVYNKVPPATAKIACRDQDGATTGSGAIVGITDDKRAIILTAYSIVSRQTGTSVARQFYQDIKVRIASQVVPASVLTEYVDAGHDLALLLTDEPAANAEVISYRSKDLPAAGHQIAVAGFQEDARKMTGGTAIRSEGDSSSALLVFSGNLSTPGHTGGPVVNAKGEMVGVLQETQKTGEGTENYALEITAIAPMVDEWLQALNPDKKWNKQPKPFYQQTAVATGGGVVLASGLAALVGSIFGSSGPDLPPPPSFPSGQ